MTIDVLIIGQGLAGTHLAFQCLAKGMSVCIIDKQHKDASSLVAAGMINPIKGKRLTKLWKSEQDIETCLNYYKRIEDALGTTILRDLNMVRIINTDETVEYVRKKRLDPEISPYLQKKIQTDAYPECHHTYKMALNIDGVRQIDTQVLLQKSRAYFIEKNCLITEDVKIKEIVQAKNSVHYKKIRAGFVIFCDGHQATHNPFWKHLPFENVKGTTLTLQCEGLKENTVYNNGKWLCPMTDGTHKLGTTSVWEFNDLAAPKEDIDYLEREFKKMMNTPYKHLSTNAGVRPVLKSRIPIAMLHPQHRNVGTINGLGGHGCFLAPLMAEKMIAQITKQLNKQKQHS